MTSSPTSGITRALRTVQKLEYGPERAVKESVTACRSVAKALAEHSPQQLTEFKDELHAFLLRWAKHLEATDSRKPPHDGSSQEDAS